VTLHADRPDQSSKPDENPAQRLKVFMKLPNADKAIISPEKLRDYILSPIHPIGRFKATFFKKLGYSAENWRILEQDLRNQILPEDVMEVKETQYGQKFIIRGLLTGPAKKTVQIITVWAIIKGEDIPKFITAYPGGKDEI